MQVREYVVRRLLKLPLVLLAVTLLVFGALPARGEPDRDLPAARHEPGGGRPARGALRRQRPSARSSTSHGSAVCSAATWAGRASRSPPSREVLPARFVATMELATAGAVIAIVLGVALGHLRRLAAQSHGRPHHACHHRERRQPALVLVRPARADPLLPRDPDRPPRPVRSRPSTARSPTTPASTRSTSILNLNPAALWDSIAHLALPALVLGFEGMAVIARMVRSSLVEETGRGLRRFRAREGTAGTRSSIRRHALQERARARASR